MTADGESSKATAAKLSPRKQRQSIPLSDSFFGGPDSDSLNNGANMPSAAAALLSSQAPFSSSPAFATPLHPMRPFVPGEARSAAATILATTVAAAAAKPTILPIILPPATLRPLAFRTFTKKHSLTLKSSALQELATFIGRHCGSGWREEGLAEHVLEETAKSWKNRNCGFIVDGASTELKEILKTLEGNMSGGRIVVGGVGSNGVGNAKNSAGPGAALGDGGAPARLRSAGDNSHLRGGIARQNSLLLDRAQEMDVANTRLGLRPSTTSYGGSGGMPLMTREDSGASAALRDFEVDDHNDDGDDEDLLDPRRWLKVVGAFEQPRMVYNVAKKHFER
ncbi:DNA-directed DNA polymerase epsilon, subunit B [Sporothrix epigloea]|uniref:DNA-directed DNA polymerase epsilon, subunit B n=1 Tax=Sporothrix epigloea TaxID=1892477 RepID=A0ABP0DAJ4_9PEZI